MKVFRAKDGISSLERANEALKSVYPDAFTAPGTALVTLFEQQVDEALRIRKASIDSITALKSQLSTALTAYQKRVIARRGHVGTTVLKGKYKYVNCIRCGNSRAHNEAWVFSCWGDVPIRDRKTRP